MQSILLDGYQVPGITAQFAIRNRLIYRKESGGYDNAAYDVSYLDNMIQKNRYLFKLIARNCENVF